MKKAALSALLAIPAIAAGAAYLTPTHDVLHADYKLVDEALIIVPVENAEYVQDATNLYLDVAGFDGGTVSTLNIPEVVPNGTLDDAVNQGVQQLVSTIETDYHNGDMADGPLYVFGYSQSSVVMGMAEQQLYDDGVPSSDLNLVEVGDSASAEGGYLNSYIESLPTWEQPYVVETFNDLGAGEVLGQTTPDNLYPTEVYSLSGDGWAIYDDGMNHLGMYTDHLEYLGLTPQEIASAGPPVVDGLTDYFTIPDSMVNNLEALWTEFEMAVSVF
jgi:hypothetical protein